MEVNPVIHESWKKVLHEEFQSDYFQALKQFLVEEKKSHTIYPPGPLIFNAFNSTPFDAVKVVILGQDPYHGAGQAHGLCFSVPRGIKPPPSLVNIFKELKSDLDIPIPAHGNLESWAQQGVFLLNATLTVRANTPLSHAGKGWEVFTNKVVERLSQEREHLVFILWGRNAQAKESLIDNSKHLVLKSAHPSPFSATAFFGCRHFSKANDWLSEKGLGKVDWRLE
ncbi:MAG: uracil-DNA glycosylase [Bacteroidales bacterium]